MRAQIEILFLKNGYSQRQIDNKKLKICRHGMQYLSLETGTNVDKIKLEAVKATTVTENKHLIIESKRH